MSTFWWWTLSNTSIALIAPKVEGHLKVMLLQLVARLPHIWISSAGCTVIRETLFCSFSSHKIWLCLSAQRQRISPSTQFKMGKGITFYKFVTKNGNSLAPRRWLFWQGEFKGSKKTANIAIWKMFFFKYEKKKWIFNIWKGSFLIFEKKKWINTALQMVSRRFVRNTFCQDHITRLVRKTFCQDRFMRYFFSSRPAYTFFQEDIYGWSILGHY